MRTHTAVDPTPERHVGALGAREVDLLGVGDPGRVAVGGTEVAEDGLAGVHGDTADVDVGGGGPVQRARGRVDPQQLLHGTGNERGIGHQLGPRLGVACEVGEPEGERVGHGIEPRHHEQVRDVEQLFDRQPVTRPALGDELAEDVVTVARRRGDEAAHVLVHLGAGLPAAFGVQVGVDHRVLPAQEGRPVLEGEAVHREEHPGRVGHEELGPDVDRTSVDERVDELVDLAPERRFEPGQLLGREERVEQAAVANVVGRVDLERDERTDVAEVGARQG